jgi:hypothetical protein
MIGVITSSAILACVAPRHRWQFAVLAAGEVVCGCGAVSPLLGVGALGVGAALAGWSAPSGFPR